MTHRAITCVFRGAIRRLDGISPTRSVLEFLRVDEHATGTKEGCADGDCGACTVVLGDAVGGRLLLRAVDSCLTPVAALDRRALFTVEDVAGVGGVGAVEGAGGAGGIGGVEDEAGLHPVQQALVTTHGSQCGFCTPGIVMSLFAWYDGHPDCPDRRTVEQLLAGNVCRCGCYRSVLDAVPVAYALPRVALDQGPILAQLAGLAMLPDLDHEAGGVRVRAPRRLDDVAALVAAAGAGRREVLLVAGGTDLATAGLLRSPSEGGPSNVVLLSDVAELAEIGRTTDAGALVIGAAVPLADAFAALSSDRPEWAPVARRFAGTQVRNAGTLAGNLVTASPVGDAAPGLIASGARVVLRAGARERRLAVEDFLAGYRRTAIEPGEFVVAVEVPPPAPGTVFRTWKVSKRVDQDISAVTGAFEVRLEDGVVADARIAFGGVAESTRRARATESALIGRPWAPETVGRAAEALSDDAEPISDVRASAGYRRAAAAGLLHRLWEETS